MPDEREWEVVKLHIYVITLMEFNNTISWLDTTTKEWFVGYSGVKLGVKRVKLWQLTIKWRLKAVNMHTHFKTLKECDKYNKKFTHSGIFRGQNCGQKRSNSAHCQINEYDKL